MKTFLIIGICAVLLAAIAFVLLLRKKPNSSSSTSQDADLIVSAPVAPEQSSPAELAIQFDELDTLSEVEEAKLVEIKDKTLLAKIDNLIPGTMRVIADTGATQGAQEMVKEAGNLYRAIIPNGTVLDQSRSMEGAFRGTYREVANRFKGQADFVPVDTSTAKELAAVSVANVTMNVASMVVGQYYMTQINNQLESISNGLEKISDFQKNEYKGKIYALVAEVQRAATFQFETMANNELRNRELIHLQSLEHACAELLGQVNCTLQEFSKKTNIDYKQYEQLVGEAQMWFQYQRVLLKVMQKVADLTYALNLGAVSRENSTALLEPNLKQASAAQESLRKWHTATCKRLGIDVDSAYRERQGLEKALFALPAFFDEDYLYKAIPKRTARQIKKQASERAETSVEKDDLFREDVQLIAKDGKLYYLPETTE